MAEDVLVVMGLAVFVMGAVVVFFALPASAYSPPTLLTAADFQVRVYDQGIAPAELDPADGRPPMPAALTAGQAISGEDLVTGPSYGVSRFQFQATFTGDSDASGFDECAVFCTDTLLYNGTEFGFRYSFADGNVYAYTQTSSASFQEVALFANDGLVHSYDVRVSGAVVTFYVDGVKGPSLISLAPFPAGPYWPTLLCHRYTSGWASQPSYGMDVGQVTINGTTG